jgi:response regulator RpfG family c-di-GMP phosphodiesterase
MANQEEKPKRKVLLIHDHPDTTRAAVKYLQLNCYEVVGAKTLADARQQLKDHPDITFVLVDGGMPNDENDMVGSLNEKNTVVFLREITPLYGDKMVFVAYSVAHNKALVAAGCQEACRVLDEDIVECLEKWYKKYFSG